MYFVARIKQTTRSALVKAKGDTVRNISFSSFVRSEGRLITSKPRRLTHFFMNCFIVYVPHCLISHPYHSLRVSPRFSATDSARLTLTRGSSDRCYVGRAK